MGLLCRADSEGRVYPRNLQAAAVLQILRQACQELGVTLACDWGVVSLAREAGGFRLESAQGERPWCARCVLACGGKASPKHSCGGGRLLFGPGLGPPGHRAAPGPHGLEKPQEMPALPQGHAGAGQGLLAGGGQATVPGERRGALWGGQPVGASARSTCPPTCRSMSLGRRSPWICWRTCPTGTPSPMWSRQAKAHPSRQAWELFAGALNLRVGEELLKELSVPKEAACRDLSRQQLRKAAVPGQGLAVPRHRHRGLGGGPSHRRGRAPGGDGHGRPWNRINALACTWPGSC